MPGWEGRRDDLKLAVGSASPEADQGGLGAAACRDDQRTSFVALTITLLGGLSKVATGRTVTPAGGEAQHPPWSRRDSGCRHDRAGLSHWLRLLNRATEAKMTVHGENLM